MKRFDRVSREVIAEDESEGWAPKPNGIAIYVVVPVRLNGSTTSWGTPTRSTGADSQNVGRLVTREN